MRTRILVILISGLVVIGALGIVISGINLPADSADNQKKPFSVRGGEGFFEIAANLEKERLIKNRLFFEAAVIFLNGVKRLQAGDYELNPSLSPLQIVEKMIKGETAAENITIPEGWTIKDIAWFFENKGAFQTEELYELPLKKFSDKFGFLREAPKNAGLEGYLFPDTYQFKRGEMTAEIVAETMLENFGKKMAPEMKTEIKKQGKTIFEIITMASLLEKEVKTLEEKKLASGILWKRLGVGMRLQVDATLLYALAGQGQNSKQITFEQTQIDSLYNTYKYAGLPPGPIANPGLDSIVAAIYPTDSLYWYYLSTPAGQTLFSQTLEQHNIKKVKYLPSP